LGESAKALATVPHVIFLSHLPSPWMLCTFAKVVELRVDSATCKDEVLIWDFLTQAHKHYSHVSGKSSIVRLSKMPRDHPQLKPIKPIRWMITDPNDNDEAMFMGRLLIVQWGVRQ
jgi:hypothetical protein